VERERIVLDTSILIDYFRKSNKENSVLYKLGVADFNFVISIFTVFEIYNGVNKQRQFLFWNALLKNYAVIEYKAKENMKAIEIYKNLKLKNKLIELPDIFIAATALANNLKIATLNKKHFNRIKGLQMHNFIENNN